MDEDGCSGAQLIALACPSDRGDYKNHGEYVSCVAQTVESFVGDLITEAEKEVIVSAAGQSLVGKKEKPEKREK